MTHMETENTPTLEEGIREKGLVHECKAALQSVAFLLSQYIFDRDSVQLQHVPIDRAWQIYNEVAFPAHIRLLSL